MIKINLTPFEELDNPRWWVPDVVIIAIVVFLTFGGAYFYISTVEAELVAKEMEKANMTAETAALQTEVAKFNDLNQKIATLDTRKTALKRITESKLMRYLPVILMENIQNLKPEKVWLTGLAFVDKKKDENSSAPPPVPVQIEGSAPAPTDGSAPPPGQSGPGTDLTATRGDVEFPVSIEISGMAVDNISIAEFMLSLKATQNQAFEKSDLRTQLFFSDVSIAFSAISTEKSEDKDVDYLSFKLILSFKEKLEVQPEGKFSQFIDEFRKTGQARVN
ncbi:MAG: hypothetical protein EOP10_11655 [Proteobacteria bacterium]|nr:MAG: hypothetical protein EOP10_11655 [Pseudomonadota bacterium]